MSSAYYNEIDPVAAAWLRELIAAGEIAPGDVDERSIADVRADDLVGYAQCHFFAGIGGWSRALRLAGWPDDRPAWTGSCPCQPFSVAGKGAGTADARHLWPEFRRLIAECAPAIVFGEQVASRAGRSWLSGVRADLEDLGYGVGAADLCAAGVGAPHIRQRLWWGAIRGADGGRDGLRGGGPRQNGGTPEKVPRSPEQRQRLWADAGPSGAFVCGLGQSDQQRRDGIDALLRPESGAVPETAGASGASGLALTGRADRECGAGLGDGASASGGGRPPGEPRGSGAPGGVGDDGNARLPARERAAVVGTWGRCEGGAAAESGGAPALAGGSGQADGGWADADWLRCRDGRWRPARSGSFPLAPRLPRGLGRGGDPGEPWQPSEARVPRLRGYGNAIVPQVAAVFVDQFVGALDDLRVVA